MDANSLFKVIVVGEKGTGKTCFLNKYVHNLMSMNSKPTLGVEFSTKDVEWDGIVATLTFWDISGQERYGEMTRVFYQGAHGAFICYDVTRPDTLQLALEWKKDIDIKVTQPDGRPIPCLLLANKCDLPPNPPRSSASLNELCQENGFLGWVETSSKDNINISRPATLLLDQMLRDNPVDTVPAPAPKPFPTPLQPQVHSGCLCRS
eukprot:NODE_1797_length_887_cov_270.941527_g1255_i0.p1 GENE.NODE_1797_length_887_cov_270.941527_g1255_i0~~NODE_1797_length_887_cov_270.941527_g1255_i0.p1  ORF type:complete len:206 (+),score=14.27 NODE_1797_length_887_cov_270.941527_g1255_i0:74-691(+)